ncbi:hypothetical protein BDV06DRAFT_136789 [Aspergillus oleicola]
MSISFLPLSLFLHTFTTNIGSLRDWGRYESLVLLALREEAYLVSLPRKERLPQCSMRKAPPMPVTPASRIEHFLGRRVGTSDGIGRHDSGWPLASLTTLHFF